MNLIRIIYSCVTSSFLLASVATAENISIKKLRVEYAEHPLGIDTEKPHFSWQLSATDDQRGIYQTAYRLVVTDEKGDTTWNSGKITDGHSVNITYAGKPLYPETGYNWQVCVWDQNNKRHTASSRFETGLLESTTYEHWNNAKWIGGGDKDMVLYADYLPVFKLEGSFTLTKNKRNPGISFIYGANDPRLMDANKNIWQVARKQNESYIRIELDATPVLKGKQAVLNVFRTNYAPSDTGSTPLKSILIPTQWLNKANLYTAHTLTITSNLGHTELFFDKSPKLGYVAMNPIGQGGDFIAFPVVGKVGIALKKGQKIQTARIGIRNFRNPSNLLNELSFVPDKRNKHNDTLTLDLKNPTRNAMPMLRTVFNTKNTEIVKARLYITSRGIYDAYINGQRVNDDFFNPGASQYNRTLYYQTIDLTNRIVPGQNAIGVQLGEGWWSGGATYVGENWNFFGDRQSVLAKLVITYKDGRKQTVVTDPSTWKYYNDSPVRYGSFFQGEVYDARLEEKIKGWSTPTFNDSLWKQAVEVPLTNTVSTTFDRNTPKVDDYSTFKLRSYTGPAISVRQTLTAQSVKEVRPGVFLYDMGQNMAGVPRLNFRDLKPGTTVKTRYAEVTYPDLPEYAANKGMAMMENIRAAMTQDIYIAKGDPIETFEPRFTYHGYRYLEITGLSAPLPLIDVQGKVLSSIDSLASTYETSNPLVNKLWENTTWSARANFMSLPTDCPQRNERLGWAGDISVFSPTATYLTNAAPFLSRYLQDMRDVQRSDGRFADIAPLGGGFGGMLWGTAGITIPWEIYQQYNDTAILKTHYPAMRRYMTYLKDKNLDPKTHLMVQEKNVWNLGDWLSLQNDKNDDIELWDAYYIYTLDLMSKMATVLGKEEDARQYAHEEEAHTTLFLKTYYQAGTNKTIASGAGNKPKGQIIDTQASYALPLAFHIWDNEHRRDSLARNLSATIRRNSLMDDKKPAPPYSLLTGFIGTAWISQALSENGLTEDTYRLLQQTSFPSWLYPVTQGATTIWERLNSYTHANGFGGNNRMNSFNHYSFGSVVHWMYAYSLGIQRDEHEPGFKHFILAPEPDPTGKMIYAQGHYDSMYGRIKSSWRIKDTSISYAFTIPANTSATVRIPAHSLKAVKLDGKYLSSKTIFKNGIVSIELSSGTYTFEVSK